MNEKQVTLGVQLLELEFGKERVKDAIDKVARFRIEIPSWIFGEFGGGRFGDYMPPAFGRTILEKLDDAAMVNKITGAADSVAMHMLWDFSDDCMESDMKIAENIAKETKARGLRIGSISPTYFLRGSYRGSLSATEKETRERYINQTILAGEIAEKYGDKLVTLWVSDGSAYPGQVELRKAYDLAEASIVEMRSKMINDVSILIEYKVFEPGTYSTVISDWGSAYMMAKKAGGNTGVLVDLGHHAHATNIEQIVARLINDDMKCGFHFNTRYAADDDHSVEPNGEMARIFYELVAGNVVVNSDASKNWAYMIDQCSSRENRIHAILHSIDSLQISLAKAALVDSDALAKFQDKDEIILANRLFNNAMMNADVRPLVGAARLENNLPLDPVAAYVESGYQEKIEKERQ